MPDRPRLGRTPRPQPTARRATHLPRRKSCRHRSGEPSAPAPRFATGKPTRRRERPAGGSARGWGSRPPILPRATRRDNGSPFAMRAHADASRYDVNPARLANVPRGFRTGTNLQVSGNPPALASVATAQGLQMMGVVKHHPGPAHHRQQGIFCAMNRHPRLRTDQFVKIAQE